MNLEEIDRAHLIHPVTEFRKHEKTGPRIVTGGEGIRIHLADGKHSSTAAPAYGT